VVIERKGVAGKTHKSALSMGDAHYQPGPDGPDHGGGCRAAMRQESGCYTLIELPLVDFLPGEREDWISSLV